MNYPNFNEEKKFWKKGFKFVVGIDEAGRGPLAGPVVAGAVCVKNPKHEIRNPKQIQIKEIKNSKHVSYFDIRISKLKIRDSKKLSEKQRKEVYNYFKNNSAIEWGIGIVSEKVIDKINILEATKLAMLKAVKDLEKSRYSGIPPTAGKLVLVIDGNIKLDLNEPASAKGYGVARQKSIIKADQKVFSCALASIFAKVTRDKIMQKLHKKYPEYGFDIHKGYGTAHHFKMLRKHGSCKIHRKSFEPVKSMSIKFK